MTDAETTTGPLSIISVLEKYQLARLRLIRNLYEVSIKKILLESGKLDNQGPGVMDRIKIVWKDNNTE